MADSLLTLTLLGARSTGKTCYLTATHNGMEEQESRTGFRFTPRTSNGKVDGTLYNNLASYWEGIEEGEWPSATLNNSEYQFGLNNGIQATDLLRIKWLDYGGERTISNDDNAEKKALTAHLSQSQAITLLINGDYIKARFEKKKVEAPAYLRRLMLLVELYKQENPTKPNPFILLVITKADLLDGIPDEFVWDEIKKSLNTFFKTDDHWLVAICKTSLGEVNEEEELVKLEPSGFVESLSVIIYFGLCQLVKLHTNTSSRHYTDAKQKDWGWLGFAVLDFFTTRPREDFKQSRQFGNDYAEKAGQVQAQLNVFFEKYLQKDAVAFFYRGEPIDLEQFKKLVTTQDWSQLW